jgi:hypothetical protein
MAATMGKDIYRMQRLNLVVVAHEQPVYDFLQAVAEILPESSTVWMVNLQTKEADVKLYQTSTEW